MCVCVCVCRRPTPHHHRARVLGSTHCGFVPLRETILRVGRSLRVALDASCVCGGVRARSAAHRTHLTAGARGRESGGGGGVWESSTCVYRSRVCVCLCLCVYGPTAPPPHPSGRGRAKVGETRRPPAILPRVIGGER